MKKRRPTERQVAVAEALAGGAEIKATLLANGYANGPANMGLAGVPKVSLLLMLEKQNPEMHAIITGGYDAPDYKALVLARLTENVVKGRDGGVASAKALGSIRELNMFTPDSQVGVVIVQAPGMDESSKLIEGDSETKE